MTSFEAKASKKQKNVERLAATAAALAFWVGQDESLLQSEGLTWSISLVHSLCLFLKCARDCPVLETCVATHSISRHRSTNPLSTSTVQRWTHGCFLYAHSGVHRPLPLHDRKTLEPVPYPHGYSSSTTRACCVRLCLSHHSTNRTVY